MAVFLYPDTVSRPPNPSWTSYNPVQCDVVPYNCSATQIVCITRAIEIDLKGVGTLYSQAGSTVLSASGGAAGKKKVD